jgi:hypothetical protein
MTRSRPFVLFLIALVVIGALALAYAHFLLR